MGHVLTLGVPEELSQALIQKVDQTGQPPEAVAVQLLAIATQHRSDDPLEHFIGAFHSGDWADQHDAYLGKAARGSMDLATSKGHL